MGATRYLGVHVETVRRWAREGAIPAANLGNRGRIRFKREDLGRSLGGHRTALSEASEVGRWACSGDRMGRAETVGGRRDYDGRHPLRGEWACSAPLF